MSTTEVVRCTVEQAVLSAMKLDCCRTTRYRAKLYLSAMTLLHQGGACRILFAIELLHVMPCHAKFGVTSTGAFDKITHLEHHACILHERKKRPVSLSRLIIACKNFPRSYRPSSLSSRQVSFELRYLDG